MDQKTLSIYLEDALNFILAAEKLAGVAQQMNISNQNTRITPLTQVLKFKAQGLMETSKLRHQ